jgi:hypothetical protein
MGGVRRPVVASRGAGEQLNIKARGAKGDTERTFLSPSKDARFDKVTTNG